MEITKLTEEYVKANHPKLIKKYNKWVKSIPQEDMVPVASIYYIQSGDFIALCTTSSDGRWDGPSMAVHVPSGKVFDPEGDHDLTDLFWDTWG